VALATGGFAVFAISLFLYYFIDIPLPIYKRLEASFAPTAAGLILLWFFVIRRLPRFIDRYLERRDAEGATAAYREAQSLPFKLAGLKVLSWMLAAAAASLQGYAFGLDGQSAILMFVTVLFITVGGAQFEVIWHRATLRPLL
jgi:hypothetical protein